MLVLCCEIKIGELGMRFVHDVKIDRSIHSFVDTATVKLPASARLRRGGLPTPVSAMTETLFQEGNPVTIRLGYNDQLETEFTGFVRRVNFSTPCEIECEGYSWLLRKKKIQPKEFKNATVREILQYITDGTAIELSEEMPDTKPGGVFRLLDDTALEGLERLKKDTGLAIYFINDTLYAGPAYTAQLDRSTTYRLGYNTIKDGGLKYRRAEDSEVQVRATYRDAKGKTHLKVIGPSGGIVVSKTFGLEVDSDAFDAKVKAHAEGFKYAGYSGKIVAFLQPYAGHGWKAVIQDEQFPERGGTYLIASVEVQFGIRGGRRIVEITKQLIAPK